MKPMILVIAAVVCVGFGKKDTLSAVSHLENTGACVRHAAGSSPGDQILENILKCR